ncbi:MAG: zf-HC2 domain-containing protein [Lachnospiraceae bacterium]|nr:zf-HC2 domain-containing protein [Lachnospiraceae bacterium]
MKLSCNVIRDLLPLYADQICSEESKALVKEHLTSCKDCSGLLQQMCSKEMENRLETESVNVLREQADFFKRKSAMIGAVIAGIFMIPILVCLIVNLATGAALDWFFIVLASLITAASLIVVPLMMPDNKMLWTLGTFTTSLLLLFGVICIYTHQTWFFIVSPAVLFGLSVCFLPFVVYARPLRARLGRCKGLIVMALDTLFYVLMMLSIGLYVNSPDFWHIAPKISFPCLVLVWFMFLLIRYLKCNGFFKAGICTVTVGISSFFGDYLINRWIGIRKPFHVFRPFVWNVDTVDSNIKWMVLTCAVFVGIALIVFGMMKNNKNK